MPELNDAEGPENDDDEEDGAEAAASAISPVAGVRKDGEGTDEEKNENNDDDDHGVPPRKLRFRRIDAEIAWDVIPELRFENNFRGKQR
jgi:hypothetical protein